MSKGEKIRKRLMEQTQANLQSAGQPAKTKVYRQGAETTITIPFLRVEKEKEEAEAVA